MATDPIVVHWDHCPGRIPMPVYRERAQQVYWNKRFPACRAGGPRNAECLLDPGHEGPHYGNGFDTYGPIGATRWPATRPVEDTPAPTTATSEKTQVTAVDDPAPLLACGHPDTTPEVDHDHDGQPSCVACCDTCSPGQGT